MVARSDYDEMRRVAEELADELTDAEAKIRELTAELKAERTRARCLAHQIQYGPIDF